MLLSILLMHYIWIENHNLGFPFILMTHLVHANPSEKSKIIGSFFYWSGIFGLVCHAVSSIFVWILVYLRQLKQSFMRITNLLSTLRHYTVMTYVPLCTFYILYIIYYNIYRIIYNLWTRVIIWTWCVRFNHSNACYDIMTHIRQRLS